MHTPGVSPAPPPTGCVASAPAQPLCPGTTHLGRPISEPEVCPQEAKTKSLLGLKVQESKMLGNAGEGITEVERHYYYVTQTPCPDSGMGRVLGDR